MNTASTVDLGVENAPYARVELTFMAMLAVLRWNTKAAEKELDVEDNVVDVQGNTHSDRDQVQTETKARMTEIFRGAAFWPVALNSSNGRTT